MPLGNHNELRPYRRCGYRHHTRQFHANALRPQAVGIPGDGGVPCGDQRLRGRTTPLVSNTRVGLVIREGGRS